MRENFGGIFYNLFFLYPVTAGGAPQARGNDALTGDHEVLVISDSDSDDSIQAMDNEAPPAVEVCCNFHELWQEARCRSFTIGYLFKAHHI